MLITSLILAVVAGSAAAVDVNATHSPEPERARVRAIYERLVNSNTSYSTGQTTPAAEAMAQRLLAAGFPGEDVFVGGAARTRRTWWCATAASGTARPLLCWPTSTWWRRSARTGASTLHAVREKDG
jgi:hypothetical protein